jgi:hypothetical protein
MCPTSGRSPIGQIKSEGETENEKDSSKKGIEAGQREAVEEARDRCAAEAPPLTLLSLFRESRVAGNQKGAAARLRQPLSVFLRLK